MVNYRLTFVPNPFDGLGIPGAVGGHALREGGRTLGQKADDPLTSGDHTKSLARPKPARDPALHWRLD